MSEQLKERNNEIIRLRESGISYQELGKHFGISTERARQIVELEYRTTHKRSVFGTYGNLLSRRTLNILRRYNVNTVDDLLALDLERARKFRNAGNLVVEEIANWQLATLKDLRKETNV